MEDKNENDVVLKGPIILIIPLIGVTLWFIFWIWTVQRLNHKFEDCSFYTIATPTEMTNSQSMFFTFKYHDKIISSYTTVGAGDLGLTYTISSAMKKRYWIRVSCEDLKFNEMQWEIVVPDTLKYIPQNGWNKIPYELDN